MPPFDAAKEAQKIADSLQGYIPHMGSYTKCRHCELQRDLEEALVGASQSGEAAGRERAAQVMSEFRKGYNHVSAPTHHGINTGEWFADGWRLACDRGAEAIRQTGGETR